MKIIKMIPVASLHSITHLSQSQEAGGAKGRSGAAGEVVLFFARADKHVNLPGGWLEFVGSTSCSSDVVSAFLEDTRFGWF